MVQQRGPREPRRSMAVGAVGAVIVAVLVAGLAPPAGAIPSVPEGCTPGAPVVVGATASSLIVNRTPCPPREPGKPNPTDVTYRMEVTALGDTTPTASRSRMPSPMAHSLGEAIWLSSVMTLTHRPD